MMHGQIDKPWRQHGRNIQLCAADELRRTFRPQSVMGQLSASLSHSVHNITLAKKIEKREET